MAAIEARLEKAQEKFDEGVLSLERQLEADKESLALKMVDEVIGKTK